MSDLHEATTNFIAKVAGATAVSGAGAITSHLMSARDYLSMIGSCVAITAGILTIVIAWPKAWRQIQIWTGRITLPTPPPPEEP